MHGCTDCQHDAQLGDGQRFALFQRLLHQLQNLPLVHTLRPLLSFYLSILFPSVYRQRRLYFLCQGGANGAFKLATTSRTWPGRTADDGVPPTNISFAVLSNSRETRGEKLNSSRITWREG